MRSPLAHERGKEEEDFFKLMAFFPSSPSPLLLSSLLPRDIDDEKEEDGGDLPQG